MLFFFKKKHNTAEEGPSCKGSRRSRSFCAMYYTFTGFIFLDPRQFPPGASIALNDTTATFVLGDENVFFAGSNVRDPSRSNHIVAVTALPLPERFFADGRLLKTVFGSSAIRQHDDSINVDDDDDDDAANKGASLFGNRYYSGLDYGDDYLRAEAEPFFLHLPKEGYYTQAMTNFVDTRNLFTGLAGGMEWELRSLRTNTLPALPPVAHVVSPSQEGEEQGRSESFRLYRRLSPTRHDRPLVFVLDNRVWATFGDDKDWYVTQPIPGVYLRLHMRYPVIFGIKRAGQRGAETYVETECERGEKLVNDVSNLNLLSKDTISYIVDFMLDYNFDRIDNDTRAIRATDAFGNSLIFGSVSGADAVTSHSDNDDNDDDDDEWEEEDEAHEYNRW